MHITYCEEEHAVHSKGGVTRVEGQSDEENKRINKTNNKMKFKESIFWQLPFSCDKTRKQLL